MTKFEEKLEKVPIKTIQHPVGDTKYYAAVHVKTLIAQADEEISNLKSQLQQQALPVVPEFVAEWYEEHKDDLESSIYRLCIEFNQKVVNTLKTKTKLENWFDYTENKPIETLIRMQEGYRVEKPQLFYLKNKLTTSYLALDINTGYYEHWGEEIIPKLLNKQGYKSSFTQQEIDSMQTGSYELVPVEDGE